MNRNYLDWNLNKIDTKTLTLKLLHPDKNNKILYVIIVVDGNFEKTVENMFFADYFQSNQ